MRLLPLLVGLITLGGSALPATAQTEPEGTRKIKVLNYENCVELSNAHTRVVLCHQVGGRVLHYEWKGKEALYLNPNEAEWPDRKPSSAGRFDIGPEALVPKRDVLWTGEWAIEITGPRAARMTSGKDPKTGVQLIRDFVLAPDSSHLACTQTIRNVSSKPQRWNHWSRTFAKHGGIVVIPLTPEWSRFPLGYIRYENGSRIEFRPKEEAIRTRGRFLEVLRPPSKPKLGMDSYAGWLAYQMSEDLVFVKKFKADPKWHYGELAPMTISVWYPKTRIPACELEPIGPRVEIGPSESTSFTEHWWLLENPFPKKGTDLDLEALGKRIEALPEG